MRNHSPYHNRPSSVSIPLENASVGKPFPTASAQTTSPVSTKKGEPGLICEENTSPLPHWKASWSLCCYSSHTTRAGCPIEWQTDVDDGLVDQTRVNDSFRGRPDRGWSATRPASLRRRTRRSMVETCTLKCLATCRCLCPCISDISELPSVVP